VESHGWQRVTEPLAPVAAWASDQTAVLILAAHELRKLNFNSPFAVFLVMSVWNVPTERTF